MVSHLTVCRNMNKNITPLPGIHCEFYERGRCLYEERLNPGLHEAWQCAVLAGLVREYDRFLAQTEHFDIDDGTALRILEKRLDSSAVALKGCDRFVPQPCDGPGCPECPASSCRGCGSEDLPPQGTDEAFHLACVHALDTVCVLELPVCGGVCERYVRKVRLNGDADAGVNKKNK